MFWFNLIKLKLCFTIFFFNLLFYAGNASSLQGCNFDKTVCDLNEVCVLDGLFGQCYVDSELNFLQPLVLNEKLNNYQNNLLEFELKRLSDNGYNWFDSYTQCVLAYLKLVIVYNLDYNTEFCIQQDPNNIWELIHKVKSLVSLNNKNQNKDVNLQNFLLENINKNHDNFNKNSLSKDFSNQQNFFNNVNNIEDDNIENNNDDLKKTYYNVQDQPLDEIPAVFFDENKLPNEKPKNLQNPKFIIKKNIILNEKKDENLKQELTKRSTDEQLAIDYENPKDYETNSINVDNDYQNQEVLSKNQFNDIYSPVRLFLSDLNPNKENQLDAYLFNVLDDKNFNKNKLNNDQIKKLFILKSALKSLLDEKTFQIKKEPSTPELEEIIPLTSQKNTQQLLLKKDVENFNNADMGLSNTVHKIVKGGVQNIKEDRIYLKVANNLNEAELEKLVKYLDHNIAKPNNLFFDDFLFENGKISFRVSRSKFFPKLLKILNFLNLSNTIDIQNDTKKNNYNPKLNTEKQLELTNGVAEAVYEKRKDIKSLLGVEVDEIDVGSSVNIVPIKTTHFNWLFMSVIAICSISVVLFSVIFAMQFFNGCRYNGKKLFENKKFKNTNISEVINHIESAPAAIYETLCRQRMNAKEIPVSVNVVKPNSKNSSLSSWPDETLLQSSSLDVSTGHVILGFLKNCLDNPDEITNQWNQLTNYENSKAECTIAKSAENIKKNFDSNVLPYDHSIIKIQLPQNQITLSETETNFSDSNYIKQHYVNASKIYDTDPRQIAYIAAQTPVQETCADFWQMIWQKGVVVIVNLCNLNDDQKVQKFTNYWPKEGLKVFGMFEIYLVSEHIWSEDYIVRSLYLKNLETKETRTVTQFHYLTWPLDELPNSIKSLLEFRKKVNKSYSGNASPVLVHCTDGSGRTGTYCLIDIVLNRILKGVKELNIAGSLEHLRDQRMRMIKNEKQYKFVFKCVAEEVFLLLKNLQN